MDLSVYEGRGLALTLFTGAYIRICFSAIRGKISSPKRLIRGAGVLGHFQIIKYQADIACELSHFLSDAASVCGFDERNGETSQPGDILGPVSGSYPAAVLVEVPVNDIMATVFDAPVPSVDGKDAFRIGLFGSLAGYSVGDFAGVFACFLVGGFPLDTERLSDISKLEIVV